MTTLNITEDPLSPLHISNGPKIPVAVIRALTYIKIATARVNIDNRSLDPNIGALIIQAGDQLITEPDAIFTTHFDVHIYQANASLTINEQLNRLFIKKIKALNSAIPVTTADIDCSQVNADLFPVATTLTAALAVNQLIGQLRQLHTALINIPNAMNSTHWQQLIYTSIENLNATFPQLLELPINQNMSPIQVDIPNDFESNLANELRLKFDLNLSSTNKYFPKPAHLGLGDIHNTFNQLTDDLLTISNQIKKAQSQNTLYTATQMKVMCNQATIAMAVEQPRATTMSLKPIIITNFLYSTQRIEHLIAHVGMELNHISVPTS